MKRKLHELSRRERQIMDVIFARGEATEADKDIWVTRRLAHEQDENPALEAEARRFFGVAERHPAESAPAINGGVSEARQTAPKPAPPKENSVQESPPSADETSTGFASWGWLPALAVVAVLALGLFLALRR